ncbi:MAG TPA: CsbD family protein [Pedomonas sp.]|uniref:CsbD family protein n=1 Tax=Pedomonas sp. TaxID=2976421 RepID=UPI002F41E96C
MADRIDKDRVEGSGKNLKGKLKEGLGDLTGDQKMKREGQAEQVAGKAQNSWGSAKDAARDALDRNKQR